MSTKLLMDICLEPVARAALSGANLRNFVNRGNYVESRARLMECDEFATGIDENFELTGKYRIPPTSQDFTLLVQKSEATVLIISC